MPMTEAIKRFGPELLRTIFIAAVTSLTTMFGTVQTMNLELRSTQTELRQTKELVSEVRSELKSISRLAYERGMQLEELYHRTAENDARLRYLEQRDRGVPRRR